MDGIKLKRLARVFRSQELTNQLNHFKKLTHRNRAVRFQKFYLGSGFGVFGTKKTSVRFGFGYFQKRRTVQMYELIYVCFKNFY
jgi:hypothetical protein